MVQDFTLSEAAAGRILRLKELEGDPNLKLRIGVLGGGCSGFQYQFVLDATPSPQDTIYSLNGAEVLVDDMSLELLKGSMLDFEEDLGSASFVIKNPNATAKCGCGNSFSI
ncbi:iron-sulfur cluster insertion protein ErpA [Holosporaceae bacterium 'Namur']|nr:iron-sulfur cluster insertion protein ErpA [Holosporaceae bacterium 'Namur']